MSKKVMKFIRRLLLTNAGIYIMRFVIFNINLIENIYLNWRHGSHTVELLARIGREKRLLITNNEAFQVYSCAKSCLKLPGDYAEVGVYEGGSSKLICEGKGDKTLHLFDTFAGLPAKSKYDEFLEEGQFLSSYEGVVKYLSGYKNVKIYKGLFPDTGESIKDSKFGFVHLDVDFYQSTLDSLEFFYKRMVVGGIILSHDYATLPGVKKAFDEFFADKKEVIIVLPTTQCLVVKL